MRDLRVEVQSAVARTLAEARTLDEAPPALLEAIGGALGWELGALWEVDAAEDRLRCVITWQAPGVSAPSFERLSMEIGFEPGVGLPGRVWESGEPAWIADVTRDENFPRADVAAEASLRAALAFPLLSARGCLGAIEFFTRELEPPDDELLEAMATVGHLVGQFFERRDAEAAVKASEARKAAVLEAALDAVITMDHRGRVVEFNPAAERTFGYEAPEVVGREMAEAIVPPRLRDAHRSGLARYLETGEGAVLDRRIEISGMRADGTEFPVELTITRMPVSGPPIFTGFIRDITERRRVEDTLRFLAETTALLAGSLDYETTLRNVARSAVPVVADWCVVDVVQEDGTLGRLAAAHTDPEKERLAVELSERYPPRSSAEGAANVVRTGESVLVPEIDDEMLAGAAYDDEHLRIMLELGLRSAISVPMVGQRGVLGVITLIAAESGRRYDEGDLALAEELGRRAATAVDNALLYSERSAIAQTLQQSLLPAALPAIEGVDLAARFRPAGEGIDVGGDFYDVFPLEGDRWALTIGDVVGKGPEAAALTGLVRYTLRAVAPYGGTAGGTLELLNEAILRQRGAQEFCTAVFAVLERTEGGARIEFASGGHPLPFVLRAGGTVEVAGEPGTLLGVMRTPTVHEAAVELGPGDSLVLYTDGVTDAGAPDRVLDDAELAEMLATAGGGDAAATAERLETAALGGAKARDDVAILVLRVPDAAEGDGQRIAISALSPTTNR